MPQILISHRNYQHTHKSGVKEYYPSAWMTATRTMLKKPNTMHGKATHIQPQTFTAFNMAASQQPQNPLVQIANTYFNSFLKTVS